MVGSSKKIAFLGCGNMVQALFPTWKKLDPSAQFYTYTPSGTKAAEFAKLIGGKAVKSLFDLPPCDAYIFGFKPQTLRTAFTDFKPTNPNAVGVSLLAGVTFEDLKKTSGLNALVRLMPNTPAIVGEGMMGVISKDLSTAQTAYFDGVWSGLSKVINLETEAELDLITPYSGSGPAYYFELARIMVHDLKERGLDSARARELVAQTMLGSAKMLLEANEPPAKLRDNVTSKGGVTAAVLKSFQDDHLESLWKRAIAAGHERLAELKNTKD